MSNQPFNLYRVTFADQSSKDYTAPDIGAIYTALNALSNPITSVNLVRANVTPQTGMGGQAAPPPNIYPVSPQHRDRPDCACVDPDESWRYQVHPRNIDKFGHHPVSSIYTNRLMLGDISQLYQKIIPFGVKTPESYRQDFTELKRDRTLYQFAVPALINGETIVVTNIQPSSVYFDNTGGFAVVTFTTWRNVRREPHLWLTTLKIYLERIEGSSIDLTQQQSDLMNANYVNTVPLKGASTFAVHPELYPASGNAFVFPRDWNMSTFLAYYPGKPREAYQKDFEAFKEGLKSYKLALPIGHHGGPLIVDISAYTVGLDGRRREAVWATFYTSNRDGFWRHDIKICSLKGREPNASPLQIHSILVTPLGGKYKVPVVDPDDDDDTPGTGGDDTGTDICPDCGEDPCACGSTGTGDVGSVLSVSVTPATLTTIAGDGLDIALAATIEIEGDATTDVTWSIADFGTVDPNAVSLDDDGFLSITPDATAGVLVVRATSVFDTFQYADCIVTVED